MARLLKVTCACGATGGARHGATWHCPACGAGWRTDASGREEYARFDSALRRIKWQAAGGAIVILAAAGVLAVVAGPQALLSAPVALGLFYIVFLPSYRRRLRALYARLPQWSLTPVESERPRPQ
jgi:hypothetical protein